MRQVNKNIGCQSTQRQSHSLKRELWLVKVTLCKLERCFGKIFRFCCQHLDDWIHTAVRNYSTDNPITTAAQSHNLKARKDYIN